VWLALLVVEGVVMDGGGGVVLEGRADGEGGAAEVGGAASDPVLDPPAGNTTCFSETVFEAENLFSPFIARPVMNFVVVLYY
jgi:hypothetical protein